MPERAHVTSLEALESFRANLILYVSKARPALEEVSAEVLRTKLWLENDQRVHWEGQFRRRAKALEQAQQALSSARMSSLHNAGTADDNAERGEEGFEFVGPQCFDCGSQGFSRIHGLPVRLSHS